MSFKKCDNSFLGGYLIAFPDGKYGPIDLITITQPKMRKLISQSKTNLPCILRNLKEMSITNFTTFDYVLISEINFQFQVSCSELAQKPILFIFHGPVILLDVFQNSFYPGKLQKLLIFHSRK